MFLRYCKHLSSPSYALRIKDIMHLFLDKPAGKCIRTKGKKPKYTGSLERLQKSKRKEKLYQPLYKSQPTQKISKIKSLKLRN